MSKTTADYFTLKYPMRLTPDPDGGYIFEFPDLPGCIDQFDDFSELPSVAEDVRRLWFVTASELGKDIPLPMSGGVLPKVLGA